MHGVKYAYQHSLIIAFVVLFLDSYNSGKCRRNSYTMGCRPVRGDNPRAIASGLSYVQVDNPWYNFYTTHISVDQAHYEIFRAKVVKVCIKLIRFECYVGLDSRAC